MNTNIPQNTILEPISPNKPIRALFSKAGIAGLVYLAISLTASTIFTIAYFVITGYFVLIPGITLVISVLPYAFTIPAMFLMMRKLPKRQSEKKHLKIRHLLAAFAVCILLGQIGALMGYGIVTLLQNILPISITDPLQTQVSSLTLWENLLLLGIAAPILEELVFRKLILGKITQFGDGIAIFVSAFIFALIHCNLFQFFYAFLLGLLLGGIYCRSGRLLYPILLHICFNIFGGVIPEFLSTLVPEFDPSALFIDYKQVLYLAYELIFLLLALIGIILLIRFFRKRPDWFSVYVKNIGQHLAAASGNVGIILLFVASLLINLLNLLTAA
ncbi:MAG: CPBP family intramembrane metalloprotease [Clostridiales bacterium]|nr:CPBP family intramembrane metalloprotease [Clostridiales bacterium]